MPPPSPLPISLSGATIANTLARVDVAAQYALPFAGLQPTLAVAQDWSRLLKVGNVLRLIELIHERQVTPYYLLNDDEKARLRFLTLKNQDLRAALQEGAAQIERSIGVSLPLHLRVYASGEVVSGPLRGISLFLNEAQDIDGAGAASATQVFQIAAASDPVPSSGAGVLQNLHNPVHSPKLKGHIAENAVLSLAPLTLPGHRVHPLASPSRVFLNKDHITRVGRFTFLGVPPPSSLSAGVLEGLEKFAGDVDVLCLGGALNVRPDIASEIIGRIRPRVTLAAASQTNLHLTANLGVFGLIAPASEARLELNPGKDTVTIAADDNYEWQSSGFSHRALNRLEAARTRVTHKVFGNLLTHRRDRHWSQSVLGRAIPQALRYLIFLHASPDQALNLAAREEMLIKIIGAMLEPLHLPGEDIDHIETFKELLLQCGLLEPSMRS